MRILHLNDHLAARGGIETYLLAIIPRLAADGVESVVVFGDGDASLVKQAECVPAVLSSKVSDRRQAYRLVEGCVRRYRPDVIHVHNVQNVGAIAACLDSVPSVFTAHDYRYLCPSSAFYFRRSQSVCSRTCGPACLVETLRGHCMSPYPTRGWRQYSRVQWMRNNLNRFRMAIAPSQGAARRLRESGVDKTMTRVIPYFCPNEVLDGPRSLPEVSTLLYVGRFSENKGWHVFLKALGQLPPNIRGRMVGNLSARSRAEIEDYASKCGCKDRLALFPWAGRDEIVRHYCEASVLVFPSLWDETLGIVGLEALACGVPVIASDVGGVREWLIQGKTGQLVTPGNAKEIACIARSLLSMPEGLLLMGRAGLELVSGKFSPARHLEELLGVYRSAGDCAAVPVAV